MSRPSDFPKIRPGDKTVPTDLRADPDLGHMLRVLSGAFDSWVAEKLHLRKEEKDFRKLQRKLAKKYK